MENKRIEKLLENIKPNSLVLIYSGDVMYKTLDQTFPFEVDRSFFYYANFKEENSLILAKVTDKTEVVIYKPITDVEKAKWVGGYLEIDEVKKLSKVENILPNTNMEENVFLEIAKKEIKNIYIANLQDYTYPFYEKVVAVATKALKKVLPLVPIITKQRLIKDEEEIKHLQKAIDITNLGLQEVLKNIKSIKQESKAQAIFESVVKEHNTFLAFDTISASGKNATTLHYVKNNDIIEKDSLILLDLGANYNLYCADISRTYPTNGVYSQRQRQLYDIVLKTNKEAIKMVKPGTNYKDIILFAKEKIANELIKIGKIKEPEEITKYYFHSVGHPLGLDVHDLGQRDIVLQPGMVFTIEPGLYIKDEGIGIRIEDDILVTQTGNKVLSKNILKDPDKIEEYIKENSK